MSKTKYAVIAIMFLMLGYIIGSQFQQYNELNWCVKTGLFFLEKKGIEIDVNKVALSSAIMYYQQRIDRLIATNFSSVGS